jgi:glycosyltransferase involved in cell wall biosynthesis
MKKISLSVVIPAYNEETNIRLGALEKVASYLTKQPYPWEAIIVDDGSSDDTLQLLAAFCQDHAGFTFIKNPHQGKAATVITGMLAARYDIVLFTDLDQATPLSESEKLIPWFEKGNQVVIGSRSSQRKGAPLLRLVMARGFMLLRSFFLGLKGIEDTQCGFKAFERSVAQEIFRKLKVYGATHAVSGSMVTAGFDIEVLYLAKKLGYKIKEVPVEWHYVETRRVSPLKDSWQGFADIMRIRLNEALGYYSS